MSKNYFITHFKHGVRGAGLFLLIFLFFSNHTLAQSRTVTGVVKAETGETLPGVSIQVKNSANGTVTNADGKYAIQISGSNSVLVFSFIGYTTKEVAVAGSNTINVSLLAAATQLNDVVVVGYGTQKKETLTGSVASVKGSEVLKSPAINVSNSIAGRIPGVIAIGQGGEPGNDYSSILVRGLNITKKKYFEFLFN